MTIWITPNGIKAIRVATKSINAYAIKEIHESDLIVSEAVKRIKEMNERAGEEVKAKSIIASKDTNAMHAIVREYSSPLYGKDIVLSYSENDDWYILASEDEHTISIEESLLLPKEDGLQQDKTLSKLEYLREFLGLARIAGGKGKALVVDFEREGKFLDIEKLLDSKIFTKDFRGRLDVRNIEELNKIILSLDTRIEKESEERMIESAIIKKQDDDGKKNQNELEDDR